MEKKLFVLLSVVLAFAGCRQNPYPSSGTFFLDEPTKTTPPPVADIDMPPFLECVEGKLCSTAIRGYFGDASATPALSFSINNGGTSLPTDGLPAGAIYDADKKTLNYTPDFGVVDTAKDPTRAYAVLNLEVTLRKTEDSVTVYKRRNLLITVRNAPGPMTFDFPSAPTQMDEGTSAKATLTVTSADYPAGPFQLTIRNAPAGVTAVPTSPTTFEITYEIDHSAVTFNDPVDPTTGKNQKIFPVEYSVMTASGEIQTFAAALAVEDARLDPIVSYPPSITQGLTVDFTIRVDDVNGERAPVMTPPNAMPVGKLKVTDIPLTSPGVRAHLYGIHWDGIPASEAGNTFQFPFLVCGATSPTQNNACKSYVTSISIAKGSH